MSGIHQAVELRYVERTVTEASRELCVSVESREKYTFGQDLASRRKDMPSSFNSKCQICKLSSMNVFFKS